MENVIKYLYVHILYKKVACVQHIEYVEMAFKINSRKYM